MTVLRLIINGDRENELSKIHESKKNSSFDVLGDDENIYNFLRLLFQAYKHWMVSIKSMKWWMVVQFVSNNRYVDRSGRSGLTWWLSVWEFTTRAERKSQGLRALFCVIKLLFFIYFLFWICVATSLHTHTPSNLIERIYYNNL